MDSLWAPWRMEYIEKVGKEGGCFFCKVAGEKDDRKNLILHRGREAFVVMNRYPYNNAHLMIVPYAHTADMLALSSLCRDEVLLLCGRSMKLLAELLGSEGFNCGMNIGEVAGVGVRDHIHMHLVPRWVSDVNFMPALGETKVIPAYLEDTYDKLIGSFSKL